MRSEELKAVFDQLASGYDKQWEKTAPIRDGLILPPKLIASIIESGGFETPVQFFQAGLIHAWFSERASGNRRSAVTAKGMGANEN
jgi:hypothetical protein